MKLRIAFVQLLPADSTEANLTIGLEACREAKKKGADIVLFPEMWSVGYSFSHDEEKLKAQALALDSDYLKKFASLAAELDMAIAITLLEQHEPKPRNTVCLFDRHGNLKYRYSKVHICDFGEDNDEGVLDAGDEFCVEELDTARGSIKVGSMICYDREFPESARVLMLKGAELLLVPNACPMEKNRLAQLRGRAYENMLAIATCNYPAPHPDCNGHSTLFDGVVYVPDLPGSRDICVFEAGDEPGIYLAELDVDQLRDFARREVWGKKNRRSELYQAISSSEKYTIDDISTMSGLTTRTIRNYLKDGQMTGIKEDGKWVFSVENFTDMLKNPYIKAAIKSKNTAPVFDFIADDKKNVNSACIVIDRVVDGENEAAFIENLCAMAQNEAGMNMRFEKSETHMRIILTGTEDSVRKVFNRI